MRIAKTDLDAWVGKPIGDLCQNNFTTPKENHCAHFVSHALGIRLATLCGDMKWATRRTGGSIRCNELYNALQWTGPWDERPIHLTDGMLIFVISARNMPKNVMQEVSQKHVGIHFAGHVYHFSNSKHKVVTDPTVGTFHNKFMHRYRGGDISLYFGVAP